MTRLTDKALGMKADITRREFVQGSAVALGASLASGLVAVDASGGRTLDGDTPLVDYPPTKTGLRGAHAGAYEVAHALRPGRCAISLILTDWMSTMIVSWWVQASRVWQPRIIIESSLVLRCAFYCLRITMILGVMPNETNFTKVATWCSHWGGPII